MYLLLSSFSAYNDTGASRFSGTMISEKYTVLFAKAFHGFLYLFYQLLDFLIYSG